MGSSHRIYLEKKSLTVESIYASNYSHCSAYLIAESLFTFDHLFSVFLKEHIALIHRSIGVGANSLKGRSVDILNNRISHHFFPELWEIRGKMTDQWGHSYGVKRDSIADQELGN